MVDETQDNVQDTDTAEATDSPEAQVDFDGTATVKCRIESITDAGIVGLSLSEVRENFGSILNISPNANPSVKHGDGSTETVDDDYVVEAGDTVTFALALGEKG
jgi:hypothetical protein